MHEKHQRELQKLANALADAQKENNKLKGKVGNMPKLKVAAPEEEGLSQDELIALLRQQNATYKGMIKSYQEANPPLKKAVKKNAIARLNECQVALGKALSRIQELEQEPQP